jgi:hypothetical protein
MLFLHFFLIYVFSNIILPFLINLNSILIFLKNI